MKRLYASLSDSKSIEKLAEALEEYYAELQDKAQTFVDRLMDAGISTATNFSGKYAPYIRFSKTFETDIDGVNGILIATDGVKLIREWYTDKKKTHKRAYEVSPLLLAEFGSGWLSVVLDNIPGVGQGTMPNSYGHATDPNGWFWYDYQGKKQFSIGEAPTFPMHNAYLSMLKEIDRIAKEVFGNG